MVRSEPYRTADGAVFAVTDQLRMLKAFEQLLLCISPGLHRRCRAIYDALGPRLAARLRHPLLATIAYFALKPAEWLAALCVGMVLGGDWSAVRQLYRNRGD